MCGRVCSSARIPTLAAVVLLAGTMLSDSNSSSSGSDPDSDSDAQPAIPANAFKEKTSPFGAPHQLGKKTDKILLRHQEVVKQYYPKPSITTGKKFLAPDGNVYTATKLSRHKRKQQKKVSYKNEDGEIKQFAFQRCVPMHEPNAFVQNRRTKVWGKVITPENPALTSLLPVLHKDTAQPAQTNTTETVTTTATATTTKTTNTTTTASTTSQPAGVTTTTPNAPTHVAGAKTTTANARTNVAGATTTTPNATEPTVQLAGHKKKKTTRKNSVRSSKQVVYNFIHPTTDEKIKTCLTIPCNAFHTGLQCVVTVLAEHPTDKSKFALDGLGYKSKCHIRALTNAEESLDAVTSDSETTTHKTGGAEEAKSPDGPTGDRRARIRACLMHCTHTYVQIDAHHESESNICSYVCVVTAPPPDGHSLLPRHVIARPKRLLDKFLDHHLAQAHFPDISDLSIDHPCFVPQRLQNWLNKELCKGGKRERRRPHNDLPGMCAQKYLGAIDFALSMGKLAVKFKDAQGKWTDMVDEFILTVWCHYVAFMKGRPLPKSNICQLILKYMLVNRAKVVAHWRNRLYYSSSGSIFNVLKPALKKWLQSNTKRDLIKIKNVNGLWAILGEQIFSFYEAKSGPYKSLCTCKAGFWTIPAWRRAYTFVFLCR